MYAEYLKHLVFSEISFFSSNHTMTDTKDGMKVLLLLYYSLALVIGNNNKNRAKSHAKTSSNYDSEY